ncbi:hypothetical protein ABVV53_11040 [Novosphingobium sp. RD2P27]|uniref:Transporter n=1 Tax=Novosphingobium kalidii TaxID=3230299 RepID=A0ABV2D287_9SPHN
MHDVSGSSAYGVAAVKSALSLLVAPLALFASPAAAQMAQTLETDLRPSESTSSHTPAVSALGRVSVTAGARFVSEYISRGIAFSDKPSLQPSVTMRIALPELTNGAVTNVSVFAGNWNSMQFDDPGLGQQSSGSLRGWYEADLYAGVSMKLGDSVAISGTYFRYVSPSNSFRGYNDLEFIVSYDDSALWSGGAANVGFSLAPALRMVQEAGRPGRKDALYIQPSLTPSLRVGGHSSKVRASVPLVLGLSDHYYRDAAGKDETVGFFRTGLTLAGSDFVGVPGLTATTGVDLWLLNDRVANGLDDIEVVGRAGFSMAL